MPYERIGEFANSMIEVTPAASEKQNGAKWVMASNRDIRFEGTRKIIQAGIMGTIKQAYNSFWDLIAVSFSECMLLAGLMMYLFSYRPQIHSIS